MTDTCVTTKSLPGPFLIIWTGQLLSNLGSGMTAFALGVYVFQRTGSAASFSFVILCLFLPSILLRPLGGVLADRLDRRFMIIAGDAGSALAVLFLLLSLMDGTLLLWKIYAGVACNSLFSALQSPAYKASLTDLVAEEQFAKAAGLVQLASSAQHLLSPLAAGFLLAGGSLEAILLIDIASFFFAVAAVLRIMGRSKSRRSKPLNTPQRLLTELKEGWEAVGTEQPVLHVVLLLSAITFFVGMLQTLFAPMMLGLTDAKTLGTAQSVAATGMLLSSLILGAFGLKRGPGRALIIASAAAGLSMTMMGIGGGVLLISLFFFLFFCCLPFINTGADVIIRSRIPNDTQGRAWGIIGVLSQLGYILAYLTSGLLAEHLFGPLMAKKGGFSAILAPLFGSGVERGIALMISLSGICLFIIAVSAGRPLFHREKEHTQ